MHIHTYEAALGSAGRSWLSSEVFAAAIRQVDPRMANIIDSYWLNNGYSDG